MAVAGARDPAHHDYTVPAAMVETIAMAMLWLDHVNIRTTNLDEMTAFYEDVLGLKCGKRPDFGFGGCWLYCGKNAIVHLVEMEGDIRANEAQVEHFALRASGSAKAFQARCRRLDAPYNVVSIKEIGMRQINVFDPDGNKVEVQFVAAEDDGMEPFWGSKEAAKRMKKGLKLNRTGALPDRKSKSKTTKANAALGVPARIKDPTKKRRPARKPATASA
jgi:catechol 2,3-dioxygenase-like lactoylglutathione lyase family enzyme